MNMSGRQREAKRVIRTLRGIISQAGAAANIHADAFVDSQSLTRLQERAGCRASLGFSGGGCRHFAARNFWTARGRLFAASGQNVRTPLFSGMVRSRVSRICSRPAPKRRLENNYAPASISSRMPLDSLVREHVAKRRPPIAPSRLGGRCLAIYLPHLRLKLPTPAFVPYSTLAR